MQKIPETLYISIYKLYIKRNIEKKNDINIFVKKHTKKSIKIIKKVIIKYIDDDFYKNELVYKIINFDPNYYKIFEDIINNTYNIFFCIVYDLKFLILNVTINYQEIYLPK